MTPHEYLTSKGFEYVGLTSPYRFYQTSDIVIGMCITCGILIKGKEIKKSRVGMKDIFSIPDQIKIHWSRRSIQELENFINEGTPIK